jgi:multidrug efflux pump subunit AcrA (membrane-fusion protein)
MKPIRFIKPLAIVAVVVAITFGGYLSRELWLPGGGDNVTAVPAQTPTEPNSSTEKIIVSDQAQKNLELSAKPLNAEIFWKTITVQGMVVDRPGVSDRQIVAPSAGVVAQILHIPGDAVRPGDALFTLKLSSESLHQTQTDLFKATQEINLTEAKLKRLVAAGEGIAQARVIEVESEIKRLQAAVKSARHELVIRGFSSEDIEGVSGGELVNEISVVVPLPKPNPVPSTIALISQPATSEANSLPLSFELQELKVEAGQQVQAGDMLCMLSNHQSLAIEGRAFRDETLLVERSVKEGWPVEVDFQEAAATDWPAINQTFAINYIANTIDPTTRTFAFLTPLENQSRTVQHGDRAQLLWRFRPGQKVRLYVRVQNLDDVFVLPADAVAREGADAFVFTQNVNTFERKPVHVLFHDRDRAVIANDGSLPTFLKGKERWTVGAVVRNAAAQLNRMTKAGSNAVPRGFHIHADGSLHKNEDEGKQ